MLPSQGREASSILVPRSMNSTTNAHYDFFISGKWRNRDAVLDLTKKIREKGYSVYCFLESIHSQNRANNDPEEEMARFEKLDWRNDDSIREMFEADMDAEKNSDTFALLLPAGKSCHIEAGVAYGMGKKCILIGEQKEAESLYLILSEVYETTEEFLKTL